MTLRPEELRQVLDLASSATAPVGTVFHIHDVLARCAALVNQPHPIGAIVPDRAHPAASDTSSPILEGGGYPGSEYRG